MLKEVKVLSTLKFPTQTLRWTIFLEVTNWIIFVKGNAFLMINR